VKSSLKSFLLKISLFFCSLEGRQKYDLEREMPYFCAFGMAENEEVLPPIAQDFGSPITQLNQRIGSSRLG
jgi:hypothetical protein